MNNSPRKVTVISKTHIELLVVSKEVRTVQSCTLSFTNCCNFLYKLLFVIYTNYELIYRQQISTHVHVKSLFQLNRIMQKYFLELTLKAGKGNICHF